MRKLLTFIFLLLTLLPISKANANTEKLYEKLVNDWSTIFPDGNRNAAGPRFFKYILDQNLEYEEFIFLNLNLIKSLNLRINFVFYLGN